MLAQKQIMKCIARLAVLLLLASASGAPVQAQEIRSCRFEVKARCLSGEARVIVADGVVTAVAVEADWCGRRGSPGYSCTIDASRKDKESTWTEDAASTVIANASPFNPAAPDRLKVTVGKHVSIDLDETQSASRCGAGAELPRAIVIPEQKGKACRVWLKTP